TVIEYERFSERVFVTKEFLRGCLCQQSLVRIAQRLVSVALHPFSIKHIQKFGIGHHYMILLESLCRIYFNNGLKGIVNLCYIFQTRNIFSYLVSQGKWSRKMKILFTKIYPYMVNAIGPVCLAFIGIKTQF